MTDFDIYNYLFIVWFCGLVINLLKPPRKKRKKPPGTVPQQAEKEKQAERKQAAQDRKQKMIYQQARGTLDYYGPLIAELEKQANELRLQIKVYSDRGLVTTGAAEKLRKIEKQIYAYQQKIIKAQYQIDEYQYYY